MMAFQDNQPEFEVVPIKGQATLMASPGQVHIGEPVVWTLSVHHGKSDGLGEKLKAPVNKKDGWVLVEGPLTSQEAQPDGSVRSDVSWTYLCLRPGTRTPAAYSLTLKRGAPLHVELGSLEVLSELEEGEEVPRPMAPILPIEAGPSGHGGFWLGAGLLALLVFVIWRMTRRGDKPAEAETGPSNWESLKQASLPQDPDSVRQSLFDWHRDLRAGIDHKLCSDLGALMDGPWLEESRELAGAGDMPWQEIEEVVIELERLKYLEPLPSRLTLSGIAERVGALAGHLEGAGGSAKSVAEVKS